MHLIYVFRYMNTFIMSNLRKFKITALDITGNNYMTWDRCKDAHESKCAFRNHDNSKMVSYEKKKKGMIFL